MSYTPGRTWSHTMSQDLQECRRRFYYRVYRSWNGWRRDGDPVARTLYWTKNSSKLPMYTGKLVHDAIKAILEALRSRRHLAGRDRMIERVEEKMREEIAYSTRRAWAQITSPKRATLILHEHFTGQDLHDHEIDAAVQRGRTCMAHFMDHFLPRIVDLVQAQGSDVLHLVDSLDGIPHRDFTLFMVPDAVLSFLDEDRRTIEIIDWKTGRGTDRQQIQAYGLYLVKRGERKGEPVDVASLRGRSIPLLDPDNTLSFDLEEADLEEARVRIETDLDVQETLHADGVNLHIEAFPKTEHRGRCPGCLFKFHCDFDKEG